MNCLNAEFINIRNLILDVVQINATILQFAPNSLRKDYDFVDTSGNGVRVQSSFGHDYTCDDYYPCQKYHCINSDPYNECMKSLEECKNMK